MNNTESLGGWDPDGKTPLDAYVATKSMAEQGNEEKENEDFANMHATELLKRAGVGDEAAQAEVARRREEEREDGNNNNPGYNNWG